MRLIIRSGLRPRLWRNTRSSKLWRRLASPFMIARRTGPKYRPRRGAYQADVFRTFTRDTPRWCQSAPSCAVSFLNRIKYVGEPHRKRSLRFRSVASPARVEDAFPFLATTALPSRVLDQSRETPLTSFGATGPRRPIVLAPPRTTVVARCRIPHPPRARHDKRSRVAPL